MRRSPESGQAAVELVGALPVLVLLGLGILQLLAVGYAGAMAGHAAEAAALASAAGRDPSAAARDAVPGWPSSRLRVSSRGGRTRVALRPPSLIPNLAAKLEVGAEAAFKP